MRKHAPTLKMKRYVQSHTLPLPELQQSAQEPRGTMPAYDGITEVWWESIEDLATALQSESGQEANKILAEDEARFVDLPKSNVFFSQEHTIFEF